MIALTVIVVTRNEEKNIGDCIRSVQKIADEIIVVDENSIDRTREIAKNLGASVFKVAHQDNFHITKKNAYRHARGRWILSLDADERVSEGLAKEIMQTVGDPTKHGIREIDESNLKLFQRHQRNIERITGKIGTDEAEVVAFFVPRVNYFLGKPLIHAGVYPDGVIRLTKKGRASWPAREVHEVMKVEGRVSWLFNNLEHHDSPTLHRYFARLNRYTNLKAKELKQSRASKGLFGFIYFVFLKPIQVFLMLYFRYKGFLDGARGFLWSFFSASHFPIAYYKYLTSNL